MRIRKTASKVLGSSSSFRSPPPAEDFHCADALPEELLLCQLNCSPWDVIELESNLHHFTFQEGGDEGRGIIGNGFKFEDYDEILANGEESASAAFTSTAAEEAAEEENNEKPKKILKRRGRKRKEEVINIAIRDNIDQDNNHKFATYKNGSGITYCKKNDGKGWQCKRPANSQHSLCNHHLDLLRNYSTRTNNREICETTDKQHAIKNQRRPKAAALESAGDGFYYYSGFGRGRKRSSAKPKEDASEDEDDDDKESGDGSDAPVAGDDLDDDTDEEEDDDLENRGRYRKKGRKRVKARSLKSLM